MERFCNNTWKFITKILHTTPEKGLDTKRIRALQTKYGMNLVEMPRDNKLYKRIFSFLKHRYVWIHAAIIGILLYLGNYIYAGIDFFIFLLNIATFVIPSVNSSWELTDIKKLDKEETVVIRNGLQKRIKAYELVQGDIVKFSEGTVITADLRIIDSEELIADEKKITGEAEHSEKFSERIIGGVKKLKDMKNILFKGSKIIHGSGMGVVIATGSDTQIGKIFSMRAYTAAHKHSIGRIVLNKLGNYLTGFLVMALLFFGYSMLMPDADISYYMETALFAAGCFPEVLIEYLVGKSIVTKFKEKGIEIRNFSVFERIKDVNILFLDKIGSISQNIMNVKKVYINNAIKNVTDSVVRETTFERMMEIGLLCNNGRNDILTKEPVGDIKDLALLRYADKKRVSKSQIDTKYTKIMEFPEEEDKRFESVMTKTVKGYRVNARGSLEDILSRCTTFLINGVEHPLKEEMKENIKRIDMKLSMDGMITEGFAYRNFNYEPDTDSNIESNMVFVAMIGYENPFKTDLAESLSKIKDYALIPIIFTEENKLCAIKNAGEAGLIKEKSQVIAAIETDSVKGTELKALLSKVKVFCRASGIIKSKIISMFIKDGHRVAAVGENFGDMQAMNFADISIAKGKASEAVKKAADVYTKNNFLDAFFEIMDYSKVLYNNLDRVFKTYFMIYFSEILILFASSVSKESYTLDAGGIICINIFVFTLLALVIMTTEGMVYSKAKAFFGSILLTSIVLICNYKNTSKNGAFGALVIFASAIIFMTMFNCGISFRKKSLQLGEILGAVLITIISGIAIMFLNNIRFELMPMVEIGAAVFIIFIYEVLYKKWQNTAAK